MAQQATLRVDAARELQTESLRLTAFLAPSEQTSEPTWWADLVGMPPETKTSKPSRGELVEAGAIGDRALTLSVQPGRVDWFLTRRIEEGVLPETPWSGPFGDSLDVFSPLMVRWLGMAPGVVRLALGVIVHEPVPDRPAGYRKLAQYLPAVRLDPDHSEDFLYQINRPRDSRVVDRLRINRLSRWSVAVFLPMRFALSKETVVQQPAGSGERTCRIDLDLSTDPAFVGELPMVELPNLFEELKTLAVELVTQGDVP